MPAETAAVRRRRGGGGNDGAAQPQQQSQQQSQQQQQQSGRQSPTPREALRQLFMRSVLMYAFYHYYIKPRQQQNSTPGQAQSQPATPNPPPAGLGAMFGASSEKQPSHYSLQLKNAWPVGKLVEFRVFSSLEPNMTFEEAREKGFEAADWAAKGVRFDTVDESYLSQNVTLTVPKKVSDYNSTWYAHVFVGLADIWEAAHPSQERINHGVSYYRHEFIKWLDVDLRKKGKNLLGGDDDEEDEEGVQESAQEDEIEASAQGASGEHDVEQVFRYDQVWKPTMPIVAVIYSGILVLGQLPVPAAKEFRVNTQKKLYYTPMHVNEFWMLRESHQLMNNTVKEVTIEMSFSPMSMYKWSMYKQFDNVWQRQIEFGAMAPHETEDLKRMFLETNPWLLGLTTIVSTAHTVLEALAFKNDISHWNNVKSMEGVSVRSMVWRIVMEAIIFLYLWDNETSWMITIGNGVGLVIAIWKLGKAVKFENFGKRKLFGFIPWFEITDRESYSKKTKEYDEQAMKYLGYALYPLVIMYALYTLKFEKHKSWYSWVISSLVGAVYAFGFIMMFPQIFINYKLKSVAHMPMKAMMYKTLNTIIDDLFSFIIKMPWLHRLACFRDDVVFLIILYQRWIYPVDKKRVNEFGQAFDEQGNEIVKDTKTDAAATDGTSQSTTTEVTDSTGKTKEVNSAREAVSPKSEEEKKND